MRGAATPCLRAPGGTTAAVIVVIGALWLAASTASAQGGSPYYPTGYAQTQATFVAPTMPASPPVMATEARTTSVRGLWIPGLVGLPIAWIATWVHASLSLTAGSDAVSASFIPIAGPWLVLADQNTDPAYYITTGLLQDISLVCLVLGLVIRVPEPRARVAMGDAVLEVRASGSAMSATIQF